LLNLLSKGENDEGNLTAMLEAMVRFKTKNSKGDNYHGLSAIIEVIVMEAWRYQMLPIPLHVS